MIKRLGRRGKEYIKWRDEVAIPYLDDTYGHQCSREGCSASTVDVAHIKGRGSHPHLRMELSNVHYLCRKHHLEDHGTYS